MEFLNGVIPAKVIKEVIEDYNGYYIVDCLNRLIEKLIIATGTNNKNPTTVISHVITFPGTNTTLQDHLKKTTTNIDKVVTEAKELGYSLVFKEFEDERVVTEDGVLLKYVIYFGLAE